MSHRKFFNLTTAVVHTGDYVHSKGDEKIENKRKHFLFPVFMFIGMGVGFLLIESIGGLGFVSAMFIGMGLGFLFDNLIVIEEKKISVEVPVKIGGIATSIIGVLFIIGGTVTLIAPELLEKLATYFIGLGFIVVGIFILIYGLGLVKSKPS
ncbi:MAG: hypothetical protein QXL27_05515 [Candidatus Bathyarchaeia archaeon]